MSMLALLDSSWLLCMSLLSYFSSSQFFSMEYMLRRIRNDRVNTLSADEPA